MKHNLILLILVTLFSCNTNNTTWQTLDYGVFTIKTPPGWKKIELKGIDSFVGGLTNGDDTLVFDYGWYSPDVGDEDPKLHKFAEDTVNGLAATIAIPIMPGKGYTRMFIGVNNEDRFSITGTGIVDIELTLKIFKSVVFEESDTTVNGKLTMERFREYPNGTGKTLVMQKCASCHVMNKNTYAPALKGLLEERSTEWLFKFFTNRQLVVDDSLHIKRKKMFSSMECMTYPEMTLEEVEQIRQYVMSK